MIALDIGNGSIKWGRFRDGALVEHGRLSLDAEPGAVEADAAVSVNPAVAARWKAARPALRLVGDDVDLPLPVRAAGCGHDRVCAVAGALREFEAALVLDAGTCLVATVGTRSEGVLGGAILPGPDLMARALFAGTAGLPAVEAGENPPAIGRTTPGAIRAGVDAAVVGAARELIARIRAETSHALAVVTTGTGGAALQTRIPEIEFHRPLLPLWGVFAAASTSDIARERRRRL